MSVLEECIFNLIPKETFAVEKTPRYKSYFDPKQPVRYSTFTKTGGGVYGKRDKNTNSPIEYLRKHTGNANKPMSFAKKGSMDRCENRKEPVPLRDDRPIFGIRNGKNFITENAVRAILTEPTNKIKEAENYLKKEDFGKVPQYLHEVKEEIKAENEMIEEYVRGHFGVSNTKKEDYITNYTYDEFEVMEETERIELLNALKTKWDVVNSQYQKLCHQTFFERGRLEQKKVLEQSLDTIEADIDKLSRGPILIKMQ